MREGGRMRGKLAVQVPEARVELARGCPRRILSPLRLPFRHSGAAVKVSGTAVWRSRLARATRARGSLELRPPRCARGDILDVAGHAVRRLARLPPYRHTALPPIPQRHRRIQDLTPDHGLPQLLDGVGASGSVVGRLLDHLLCRGRLHRAGSRRVPGLGGLNSLGLDLGRFVVQIHRPAELPRHSVFPAPDLGTHLERSASLRLLPPGNGDRGRARWSGRLFQRSPQLPKNLLQLQALLLGGVGPG
jgi:hypothetical protein